MEPLTFCGTGGQSFHCFSSCFCITRSRKVNSRAPTACQEGDCTLQVSKEGKHSPKETASPIVPETEQFLPWLSSFSTAFWQTLQAELDGTEADERLCCSCSLGLAVCARKDPEGGNGHEILLHECPVFLSWNPGVFTAAQKDKAFSQYFIIPALAVQLPILSLPAIMKVCLSFNWEFNQNLFLPFRWSLFGICQRRQLGKSRERF